MFHFHLVKNYFNENFETSMKCNQTFLVIKTWKDILNKIQQYFYKKKKKIKTDVKFDQYTFNTRSNVLTNWQKNIIFDSNFLVFFFYIKKKYQHWSVFNRYNNLGIESIFNIQIKAIYINRKKICVYEH